MNRNAETEALLKILERGNRQVAEGKLHDAGRAISELRCKWGAGPDYVPRPLQEG